ncbi:unnamed protein product [Aphanomyces euteiches]
MEIPQQMAWSTLFLAEIWQLVASYQDGYYFDFVPFVRLPRLPKHHGQYDAWAALVHETWTSWYAEFGTSRLDRLIACVPRMRDVIILHAVYSNDLPLLQRLHATYDLRNCKNRLLNLAASRGHVDILRFLHDIGHTGCSIYGMNLAARYGFLDVVIFLHENRTEGCDTSAMDCAAAFGHLDVLKWLHVHRTEGCTTRSMDKAAGNGHLQVVQWLHYHRH